MKTENTKPKIKIPKQTTVAMSTRKSVRIQVKFASQKLIPTSSTANSKSDLITNTLMTMEVNSDDLQHFTVTSSEVNDDLSEIDTYA
jgi:hypothetical protein